MIDINDQGAILMVDKPAGWTSFDVVKKVRSSLKLKKVGHAGTLDPLATGLLLLCTGSYTKHVNDLQALDKVYTGEIVLGKTTPSMDLETAFNSVTCFNHLTEEMVRVAAADFVGPFMQTPPIYSAVKLKGKRAYKMARQGQEVALAPRQIMIHVFTLTAIQLPSIFFELVCSKGTYVRSLAYDLGQKLGVGGYLHALCRTRIGNYRLDQATSLASLLEYGVKILA